MIKIDADVAVLGSGFGGSLVTLILNRIGLSTVLIDRVNHPRFAIGESSTPIANMILRELTKRYDLPRIAPMTSYSAAEAAYPNVTMGLKRGFSYFAHSEHDTFTPDLAHRNELLVAASSNDRHADTHWLRARVDNFFVAEVKAAQIPFFDRTNLVQIENGKSWSLTGERNGEKIDVKARFVIDASGQSAVLLRALGILQSSRRIKTNSRALFSHFRDVKTWEGYLSSHGGHVEDHPIHCDDAAVHQLMDGGWMWQLRFRGGVVSIGIVLEGSGHPIDESISPRDEWDRRIQHYPSISEQLRESAVVDPPGAIQRTGRLQRVADVVCGSNWAALPNTAGFIDPLHSTGIAQTICGVERLALVFEGFQDTNNFQRNLMRYGITVRSELEMIDQLVHGCYLVLDNFEMFTTYAMMYFAAATTYEHRRQDKRLTPGSAFLCADDAELRNRLATVYDRVRQTKARHSMETEVVKTFEREVADAIRPYNIAGLCDPSVQNMYRYTAAPV